MAAVDLSTEVMHMKQCAMCEEVLPDDCPTGEVCPACAKRYGDCGVYFCDG